MKRRYIIFISIMIVLIVMGACSAEGESSAAFSTTDNSIDEWANVPVFQTDPQGDAPVSDEDVIEVKVSNSPADGSTTEVYFLMKTAGNPAMQGQYKAAIASIDCDGNGVDQEPHDRIAVYVPSEDQYYVMRGDQSEFFSGRDNDGQVVNEYVEWRISTENLPPDEKDNVDCSGEVMLRFGSADVSDYFATKPSEALSVATVIDFTEPLKTWTITP